jgi:hypothetical protein
MLNVHSSTSASLSLFFCSGASEDLYNQHITGKADPEKSSTGRSGVESGRSQTTDAATIQHGSSSHEDGSKGEAGKSWDSSKSGGAS